jgi:hypothetical protein
MGTMRHFLRHMRTTQERRRWFADVAEVDLRRGRSPRGLPNYWWDLWRHTQKSWKEHRRTKWRRTAEK